ncbi:hypothetical protein MHBO_002507 [Bonamia ostreae]|uniref:Uncharacterized protein n=1 Tax=Bonamia ostreae TaxID=126728 RepID=A0ABV2AMK6_9EUKA
MSKNFRWSKKRQKRISSAERDFVRRWQSQKESKFLTRENTLVQEECRTGWRLERLNGPLTLSSERVKDGVVRWYSESRGVGVISVDQPPEEVYFFVEDTPDAQGICVFKILIAEFNF